MLFKKILTILSNNRGFVDIVGAGGIVAAVFIAYGLAPALAATGVALIVINGLSANE